MAKPRQSLDPGDLRRRWELRWRARTDLIWLCNNVLNYTLINEKVHGPIADRLQKFPLPPTERQALEADPIMADGSLRYTPWNNPYDLPGPRRQLILDPRSSAKTTLNTSAHTIQWLINYPHLAIALLFATEDKAEDTIKNEIKKHFQTNQIFRELFPDLVPHTRINDWGTAKSFTIPGRDAILQRLKRPPRKEPSIMSLSIDKAGTGYHFDVINCSDVVEVSNVVTPSQRNQVKERVGMLPKLLVEPNGWVKIEGTFYHPADLHSDLVKNWIENNKKELPQNWDVFIRSAFVRDTKGAPLTFTPADLEFRSFKKDADGKEISFWPERFSWDELQRIKRDPIEGGYAFACTPGWAPILMADWTEKPIETVEIGDKVVGFKSEVLGDEKAELVEATVLDTGNLEADVYEFEMQSGQKIYCTEDHRWFTARTPDKTHPSPYYPAYIGRKVTRVYKTTPQLSPEEALLWSWLGGFFDGEGSINRQGAMTLTQSPTANPDVYANIVPTLNKLRIEHTEWLRKDNQASIFILKGGRSLKIQFIQNCPLLGKADRIRANLWKTGGNIAEQRGGRDLVVSKKFVGKQRVYWIETTTGNYVSQGYASKNSQYLLDLNAADTIDRPFSAPISWTTRSDFQRVPIDFTIITVDLADTQNEKSNPSVFTTTSFDRRGHAYVREIKRGKWTSDKIIDILFDLDNKYKPIKIFIENYAYVDGFKPFIKTKSQRTGQFPPFEFLKRKRNSNEKTQRIVRALQPPYNNGEIHFLTPLVAGADDPRAPDELRSENAEITNALETELRECTLFSTGSTDDILDTLADIYLSREYFGKGRGVGGGAHIQTQQAIDTLQREQYQRAYMEMTLGAKYGPDGFLIPLSEQIESGDWD